MVKRLRLRPLTAATRVRIPIESPQKNLHPQDCRFLFLRSFSRLRTSSRPCVLMAQDVMLPGRVIFVLHICQPALVPYYPLYICHVLVISFALFTQAQSSLQRCECLFVDREDLQHCCSHQQTDTREQNVSYVQESRNAFRLNLQIRIKACQIKEYAESLNHYGCYQAFPVPIQRT